MLTRQNTTKAIGLLLFFLFAAMLARMAQGDFEFILESDFRTGALNEWQRFFTSLAPLSKPPAYAYFDGQLIVTSFACLLLRFFAWLIPAVAVWFPNDDSFIVGGSLLVNVGSYAAAGVVLYAALLRISDSLIVAVVGAFAFVLAPQLTAIGVMRIDCLIVLPMMATFYISVVIAQGQERTRHAVALGLAIGYLATLKINGPIYGVFPVAAMLSRWPSAWKARAETLRFTGVALASFAIAYLVLMARFIASFSLPEWLSLYPAGIAAVREWSGIYPNGFSTYYNVELLTAHGTIFVIVYLICALAVLCIAIFRRQPVAVFLSISFIAMSLISAFTMKYERGGYHLLPIILAIIALVATESRTSPSLRAWRYPALLLVGGVMAHSLWTSWVFYQKHVEAAQNATRAIVEVWRPAREWIVAHATRDSRICIQRHSNWALPLGNVAAQITFGPLDIPYLDPAAMASYKPPDQTALHAACDLVMLGNFHQFFMDNRMKTVASENAVLWENFYRQLAERHRPVIFISSRPASPTERIEIYSLD